MQIFGCSEVINWRLCALARLIHPPGWLRLSAEGMIWETGLLWSLISNSTSNFSRQPPPPDVGCELSPGWLCTRLAAKWPLRANKSLPKFTPIFLILPQTLVVCQNWLASNLEKDILRKCQKCRRMEDNSDWCSLVCPAKAQIISNSQALLGTNFFTLPHQRYTISDGLSPYLAKTMAYYLHWEMNCTAEIMRNFQMCKSC